MSFQMSAATKFVAAHGDEEGELAQADVCALFHALAGLEESSVRRVREARVALDATVASGARRERRAAEAKVRRRGARLQRNLQSHDAIGALQLCFLRANCRAAHSAHPLLPLSAPRRRPHGALARGLAGRTHRPGRTRAPTSKSQSQRE